MFNFFRKAFDSTERAKVSLENELAMATDIHRIAALAVILGSDYQDKVVERFKVIAPMPVPAMVAICSLAKVAGLDMVFDYLRDQLKQVQDLKDWLFIAKQLKGIDQTFSDEALVKAEPLAITFDDWVEIYNMAKHGSELEKRALGKVIELVSRDDPDAMAQIYNNLYKEDRNDAHLEQLQKDLLAWMGTHGEARAWYALLKKAPVGSPLEDAAIDGYKAANR